jgi:ankyrin repeat protein
MASILCKKGYTVEVPSQEFATIAHTPLNLAVMSGVKDMVRCLLETKLSAAPIVDHLHHGRTPLQFAAEMAALDIIPILLEAGADVNEPAALDAGGTALQLAAIKGYMGIAKLLLERGARVDAPGAYTHGRTALEGAAEHSRIDMIELLLHYGAKVVGRGRKQRIRAIKLAKSVGHYVAANYFRDREPWTEAGERTSREYDIQWGDCEEEYCVSDDNDRDDEEEGDDDYEEAEESGDDDQAESSDRRKGQDEGGHNNRKDGRDEDKEDQDEGICWLSRYIELDNEELHDVAEVTNSNDAVGRILEMATGNQDDIDWGADSNVGATGPLESGGGDVLDGAHALLGDVFFGTEWPDSEDLPSYSPR